MPPAARMGDMVLQDGPHCHANIHPPAPVPTPVPHPALPLTIIKGAGTVLIGNQPAARLTDTTSPCTLPGCVPNGPGMVSLGSATVLIENMPAARLSECLDACMDKIDIVPGDDQCPALFAVVPTRHGDATGDLHLLHRRCGDLRVGHLGGGLIADVRDVSELRRGGLQRRRRGAEPLQQRGGQLRPQARHEGQREVVVNGIFVRHGGDRSKGEPRTESRRSFPNRFPHCIMLIAGRSGTRAIGVSRARRRADTVRASRAVRTATP